MPLSQKYKKTQILNGILRIHVFTKLLPATLQNAAQAKVMYRASRQVSNEEIMENHTNVDHVGAKPCEIFRTFSTLGGGKGLVFCSTLYRRIYYFTVRLGSRFLVKKSLKIPSAAVHYTTHSDSDVSTGGMVSCGKDSTIQAIMQLPFSHYGRQLRLYSDKVRFYFYQPFYWSQ